MDVDSIVDPIIIETQKSFALILLPIILLFSVMITAINIHTSTQLKEIKSVSFKKWVLTYATLLPIGFGIMFGTYYFAGYARSSDGSIAQWIFPASMAAQALVQRMILSLTIKPQNLPERKDSHIIARTTTVASVFITVQLLVFANTNIEDTIFIYFLAAGVPLGFLFWVLRLSNKQKTAKADGSFRNQHIEE